MSELTLSTKLKQLTAEARGLLAELDSMGIDIEDRLARALEKAWLFGKVMVAVKNEVGHGNWLIWVAANVKQLSERQVRRYLDLALENPTAKTVDDLSPDSVRKFRYGFVPEKERPELEGDATLPPANHHLSLLNDWKRLQRRQTIGQLRIDEEEARKDLKPLFEWMCGLYGISFEEAAG